MDEKINVKNRISMKMQHEGLTISFMLQPHPAPWPVVGASLPCWCFGPSFGALRSRSLNLTSHDPISCPTVPTGWGPLFSVCHCDKPLLFFPRCALWSFECLILPFFALTIPWWWFNTPPPLYLPVIYCLLPSPPCPYPCFQHLSQAPELPLPLAALQPLEPVVPMPARCRPFLPLRHLQNLLASLAALTCWQMIPCHRVDDPPWHGHWTYSGDMLYIPAANGP